MILLTATQINPGHFRFKIHAPFRTFITSDRDRAAKVLAGLGVTAPEKLIEDACKWGFIEIFEESSGRQ